MKATDIKAAIERHDEIQEAIRATALLLLSNGTREWLKNSLLYERIGLRIVELLVKEQDKLLKEQRELEV